MFISFRTSIKRGYENIPKKESRVKTILGIVLFFTSLMLIPSMVLAIVNGENIWAFLVPMFIGLSASVYMFLRYKLPNDMRPADGLMMMFSVWILLFAFGTLPFLFEGMSLIDSFFESVSGFTTTGATILKDVEAASSGIILWRVTTNWIGGIIIVMMFMFIIPMVVSGGRGLLKNEMSGSGGGNLSMKLGNAARQFIVMYVFLTAVFTVLLLVQNVSFFDSVVIAMSSISIGGFMSTNDSMASFSIFVKITVIFFMIVSATNFYLHYRALFKADFKGYGRNEECRIMIIWFFFIALMILLQCFVNGVWKDLDGSSGDKFVDILFSVVSVGTTSGMSTVDYTTHWAFIDLSLFVVLMFIGGSSGSTSGGVKVSRIIITVKALINEIRQQVHPNAIYTVRYNGEGISHEVVHTAMVIVLAFLIIVGVGAALFNIDDNLTIGDAVYLSVAMVTNTGTGAGLLFSNYADMEVWAKLVSCALMFLGRMEILAILVIFTPGFWLEFLGRGGINDIKAKFLVITRIRKYKRDKESESEDSADVSETGEPYQGPPAEELQD